MANEKLDKIVADLDVGDLAITEAEVRGMLNAAGLSAIAADSAAVQYFTGQINAAILQAQPALYEAVRAELTGTASDATLAAARAIAQREASTWAVGMAKTEINKMGETVAYALEQGWHPDQTARFLDNVKGLDSNRAATLRNYMEQLDARDPPLSQAKWERMLEKERVRLLNDRKRVIAQTEQGFAQEEGARVDALARGDQFKVWLTVGDGQVSDACEGNESEGWIPIDDEFQGGVQAPLQHPRCRCTLAYRKAEPSEAAKSRASARSVKTQLAKEEAQIAKEAEREAARAAKEAAKAAKGG